MTNGWSIHGSNGWGSYVWQSELLFLGDILKKNDGLQGNTLSGPRITTGFGPFETP